MSSPWKRRVSRLERGCTIALPHHLPPDQWTDEQIIACMAQTYPDVDMNVTDERLNEIIALEKAKTAAGRAG